MLLSIAALIAAGDLVLPVERRGQALSGGTSDVYRVTLAKDQVLRGVVVQRGIDVVVAVRTPDGRERLSVDSPNGTEGDEPVLFVADTNGDHVLEVRAFAEKAPAGTYDIHLDARPATRDDRRLFEAVQLQSEGQRQRDLALRLRDEADYPRSRDLYRAAERNAKRALELREGVVGKDDPSVAAVHGLLGLVYDEVGRYDEGVAAFARALHVLEKAKGPDNQEALAMAADLGFLHLAAGHFAEAEALFRRVLAKRAPDDPRQVSTLNGLGNALLHQGKLEEAEAATRRALALRETVGGASPPPWMRTQLGEIQVAAGRAADGEQSCASAREEMERTKASKTLLAGALLCLGRARLAQGDPAGASAFLAESHRWREAAVGPHHPQVEEVRAEEARARNQAASPVVQR